MNKEQPTEFAIARDLRLSAAREDTGAAEADATRAFTGFAAAAFGAAGFAATAFGAIEILKAVSTSG